MILDEIIAHKGQEVADRKVAMPLSELEERMLRVAPARDFRVALREAGISLITEMKRASPSKGVMMPEMDPSSLAALYEQGGARAISVLTDEKYFQGTLEDLVQAHQHTRVPCLRKDFVVDEYQIYEARAYEADAILLIVRVLSDDQLRDYLKLATSLGMAALVEAHTASEIERALAARAHIIGINNRDLDTLAVDVRTTIELKRLVPGGHVLVSESGIYSRDQVKMLEDGGVDAILVGESLMTSRDIRAQINELLGRNEG